MNSHIIITAATYDEVSGLVDKIEKPVVSTVGGRKITSGYIEGKFVKILITWPGIVNTVQALSAAIEDSRPSLIIQTGCAGAFKETGLKPGDIGIATEEIDIHLGIEPENENRPLNDLPFLLMKCHDFDIKNRYPVDHKLVDSAFKILKDLFIVKKGLFITSSTITATDKRAEHLYKQFGPCMENMEGSGAAHVALYYNIPFLEIRSASNIAGKRDINLWNLPLAFDRGASAIFAFIRCFDLDDQERGRNNFLQREQLSALAFSSS